MEGPWEGGGSQRGLLLGQEAAEPSWKGDGSQERQVEEASGDRREVQKEGRGASLRKAAGHYSPVTPESSRLAAQRKARRCAGEEVGGAQTLSQLDDEEHRVVNEGLRLREA